MLVWEIKLDLATLSSSPDILQRVDHDLNLPGRRDKDSVLTNVVDYDEVSKHTRLLTSLLHLDEFVGVIL